MCSQPLGGGSLVLVSRSVHTVPSGRVLGKAKILARLEGRYHVLFAKQDIPHLGVDTLHTSARSLGEHPRSTACR